MRKRLAGSLQPGEQIGATVALGFMTSVPGRTVTAHRHLPDFGGRYLDTFLEGADLETRLRHDLGGPWFTLTNRRALFHKPKSLSAPELLDAVPVEEISLHWADRRAQTGRLRLMAIYFADRRVLISNVGLTRLFGVRDEADAIVRLLGDRALEVEVPDR